MILKTVLIAVVVEVTVTAATVIVSNSSRKYSVIDIWFYIDFKCF